MLKSLSVLPKEVRGMMLKLVNVPECVRVLDMANIDDFGMLGVMYVIMEDGVRLWEKKYQSVESDIMEFLQQLLTSRGIGQMGLCVLVSAPLCGCVV